MSEALAILGDVLVFAIPTALSGAAAYYAYKQYSRRPKLKFYLQTGKREPVDYFSESNFAFVDCWLANVGKVAAHNVHGWLVYGDDPGGILPQENEHAGVTDTADNTASVYLERLMPNPPQEANTFFIDSPKLFSFPVQVWEAGPVKLKYRFVCDEGASTEGTLDLYFPRKPAP